MKYSLCMLLPSLMALAALAQSTPSQAQTTALTLTGGSDYLSSPYSIGWEFAANSALEVTQLGFYDAGQDGLTESHDVGIYDLSGNLLVSTTVTNADPLDGLFRYHAVSPTLLAAGQDYVITAVTGGEEWNAFSSVTTAPQLTYIEDRFLTSLTLVFPTVTDGLPADGAGWFGPNFKFGSSSTVPEPGSLALFIGLGVTGVGFLRRKRAL